MPWLQTGKMDYCFSGEEQKSKVIENIKDIYSLLCPSQIVLIHKQRSFKKSGIMVIDNYCRLEAIASWPFGLEQGKDMPNVRYDFSFGHWNRPDNIEGDKNFLTSGELTMIWELERQLDYIKLNSLCSPVVASFSFEPMTGGITGLDVFDLRIGVSSKYENLRYMRTSRDNL